MNYKCISKFDQCSSLSGHILRDNSCILTLPVSDYTLGITLAQNFQATSRLRPDDLERCFNKQGDTRLHVAAVKALFPLITLFTFRFIVAQSLN